MNYMHVNVRKKSVNFQYYRYRSLPTERSMDNYTDKYNYIKVSMLKKTNYTQTRCIVKITK